MTKKEIKERAKKIKLLLTDVDGVLTDGNMYFVENRRNGFLEIKGFHSHDGIGLWLVRQFGIKTGMITGRVSPSAEARAKALSMKYVYQGFLGKLAPFLEIAKKENLNYTEIAFIGDDLVDLPVLKKVGLACATRNAVYEVRENAHFVTSRKGGEGAVREVCELLLKSKGLWKKALENIADGNWVKVSKEKTVIVTNERNR